MIEFESIRETRERREQERTEFSADCSWERVISSSSFSFAAFSLLTYASAPAANPNAEIILHISAQQRNTHLGLLQLRLSRFQVLHHHLVVLVPTVAVLLLVFTDNGL